MIGQIINWSLHRRLFVLLSALVILIWGGYETSRMPVDVFPDLSAPTVTVVTEAHGMAPGEVESLITLPIESVLNGAAGIRRVRSSTGVGLSIIWAEFEWGTDIYQARQIVTEKLQQARSVLPADIDLPELAPVTSIMGEIMFVGLVSDKHDPMTLKTTADWTVRRRLQAVPGVAQVIPYGGDTRQYQVRLSPHRLAAYGITLHEVAEALRKTNENASAGFYSEGGQEYLIQGMGRITKVSDINETFVAMRGGQPVMIKQLGEVKIAPAPKRGTASVNGKNAVVLGIQKQPGVNTLLLTEKLDQTMEQIQLSLPKGMKIERHLFRQSDFISVSIDNLMVALRDGAILVILIVFAFLVSVRATLITLMALPLSLLIAILSMSAMGISINTMTLGGMAIALGALVDDAIIVVENIVRRLRDRQSGQSLIKIVYEATREIQGSIVFATTIIVLVFVPLFFLSGVEGRLMQPLGFAYVVSLAASLLVAITVTPVLALLFMAPVQQAGSQSDSGLSETEQEPRLAQWLKQRFVFWLDLALDKWQLLTAASVAMLVVALIALAFAGKSFLPDFNEGSLTVSANTVPGTSLEQSDQLGRRVEQILLSHPEVVSTARRTGRADADPHAQDIYASEIEVSLKMQERSKAEFLEALRRDFASIAGMNIVIGQPISHRIDHMLSGTRANIAVKIFGPDLYELRRIAGQVSQLAEEIKGAVDVNVEQQADVPFLRVKFDRHRIARYGMQVGEVAEAIETAFNGVTISKVLEGQTSFDLVLRFDSSVKVDLDHVNHTVITSPTGARVPLHGMATIYKDSGPNRISREDVQRKIVVMANVAERSVGDVVADIQQAIAQQVTLPSDYYIEYGGQFESAEQASRTLSLLGAVVILAVFLLLYVAFASVRDALLIMLNLPLALIGGVLGVYLSGGDLSIAAIIGFITLFGIATRNGVMMVAHIQNLMSHEGVTDKLEAVRRGAMERLNPILMTALATGLALVPLALSAGQPGSEIQAPMAMVILFGLISSTALNMLVVPALYLQFGSFGKQRDED